MKGGIRFRASLEFVCQIKPNCYDICFYKKKSKQIIFQPLLCFDIFLNDLFSHRFLSKDLDHTWIILALF